MVYDGYGAVLTGTMPVTLTQTLLDMPDGTTGLVHQGNGRYYDPALGRPLQPNLGGGSLTAPQTLNRHAATSFGQPGVAPAHYQAAGGEIGGLQYLLETTSGETQEGLIGLGLGHLIETYTKSPIVGSLHIGAGRIARFGRAGYGHVFTERYYSGTRWHFASQSVEQLSPAHYRVTGTDTVIDLTRIRRHYARFHPRFGFDESGLKLPLGREFNAEFAGGLLIELAFAIPELGEPWTNPYFSTGQRLTQNAVTGAGIITSSVVGAGVAVGVKAIWIGVFAVDPPAGVVLGVGIAAGVAVNATWEYVVKPTVSWFFVNVFQRPDPYSEIRNLRPLGAN